MLSMPLKLYAFALLIKYATTIVPGPACVPIVDPSCDTGISPITPSQIERLSSIFYAVIKASMYITTIQFRIQ